MRYAKVIVNGVSVTVLQNTRKIHQHERLLVFKAKDQKKALQKVVAEGADGDVDAEAPKRKAATATVSAKKAKM